MHQLGITTKFFSLGMFLAAIVALVAFNMPKPASQTSRASTTQAEVVDLERLAREAELLSRDLEAAKQRKEGAQEFKSFYIAEPDQK